VNIGRKKRNGPQVPISAMSDIGFLLLIFIMLVSLISYRHEVKIDYPEAAAVKRTQEAHNFEIWVDARGGVFYEGRSLGAAELEALLVETYTEHPDERIHIIADRNTPYEHVEQVMEILQLLQHRVVSLVAKEG